VALPAPTINSNPMGFKRVPYWNMILPEFHVGIGYTGIGSAEVLAFT